MWQIIKRWFHRWTSPKIFYEMSKAWLVAFSLLAAILITTGVVWGLGFAPAELYQSNSYRIMYIHVPSAVLAQQVYIAMGVLGAIGLIWKIKVAFMAAKQIVAFGASMAALALVTGAIWGIPTWGTWWEWDGRMTSTLIQFFLYIGVLILHYSFSETEKSDRAAAILALAGSINIPIIKFSVNWWETLHQKASITVTEKPAMAMEMLIPLLCTIFGFLFLFGAITLIRTRNEILWRERDKSWVKQLEADNATV